MEGALFHVPAAGKEASEGVGGTRQSSWGPAPGGAPCLLPRQVPEPQQPQEGVPEAWTSLWDGASFKSQAALWARSQAAAVSQSQPVWNRKVRRS